MKKILATITLVCIVFSLFSVFVPNVKGIADPTNSTLTTPMSPPNIGGSTQITQSDATTAVLPSANVTLKTLPRSTPVIRRQADGSFVTDDRSSLAEGQSHWWKIDYWGTQQGGQLPSKMNGTFTAVSNTFNNLNATNGDIIMYLPLNVAYGTSITNFIWFQFCTYFGPSGNPYWALWALPSWGNGYSQGVNINGGYIIGNTYNFELTTSGTNTVTFSIKNTNTGATWSTSYWNNTVPGLTMIHDEGSFSPASAIEGITTPSTITNAPYFQTYTGYGVTTYYYGETSTNGIPQGIGTAIWYGATNYRYFAMLSQYYISSITSSSPYGAGSVTTPNNLAGQYVNGQYAHIYGGNPGDGGNIVGQMNTLAGGQIYIYGYSTAGYYSDLYVYVSTDNQQWTQVGNKLTITQSTPYWIVTTAVYAGTFNYIAVAGYDSANSVYLHLDAVKVGA